MNAVSSIRWLPSLHFGIMQVHACQQHLAQLAGTAGMILPHVGKGCLKVVTGDSATIKVYKETAGLVSTPTSVLKVKHHAGVGSLHPSA